MRERFDRAEDSLLLLDGDRPVAETSRWPRMSVARVWAAGCCSRHCAAAATSFGLGVQLENRGALRLYLDVGLTIEREWLQFALPT